MSIPAKHLVICAQPKSDTIGAEAQMLIDTIASIPKDAWTDRPECGDRRTIIAPISNQRNAIIRIERATNPTAPNGLLSSIEITASPTGAFEQQILILEVLEILLDFETATGSDIAEAVRNIVIIDHKELDEISALPPRRADENASSRIGPAIIAVLNSATGSKPKTEDDFVMRAWCAMDDKQWFLGNQSDAQSIPADNEIARSIPVMPRLVYTNPANKIMTLAYPTYSDRFSNHGPLETMAWIKALPELTKRFA
ncbi:MAG: hypothetical protein CL472_09270 [Acidobacteria bacterium]|nr:hypothetical protein [Acidobacteriota bacterium]